MSKYLFSLKSTFAIIMPILFFLSLFNIQQAFAENVQQNATNASTDYNFIAGGESIAMKKQKRQ